MTINWFSWAKSTTRWKKGKSTQAVVGLWGKLITSTFGRGQSTLCVRSISSKKSWSRETGMLTTTPLAMMTP